MRPSKTNDLGLSQLLGFAKNARRVPTQHLHVHRVRTLCQQSLNVKTEVDECWVGKRLTGHPKINQNSMKNRWKSDPTAFKNHLLGPHFEVFFEATATLDGLGEHGWRQEPTWDDFVMIWVSFWSLLGSPVDSLWGHFCEIGNNFGHLVCARF